MSTALTHRRALLALVFVTSVLGTGCETIRRSPKVDLVETSVAPVTQALATPEPVATGSLFQNSRYRPAFEDRRARLVGDMVTIQIVENVSASQKSSSSIDRGGKLEGGISTFPFLSKTLTDKLNVGANSSNTFAGKGGTESANTFSGSITATVQQVLPNGHLVVTGEKQIGVNENVDVLRFSGTIDPRFIQPGNVIPSTQVANTRVESKGRGAQGEAQAIGWLSRFFLSVMPF